MLLQKQLILFLEYLNGHFPFNQNVWFEFSATSSCSERNSISQNSQKGGQPREVYSNFRKNFPGFFFPFSFAPGISRIFRWMVRFLEIEQFSDFLETFPGKILYHLPLFPNFRTFWLNGKRPMFPEAELGHFLVLRKPRSRSRPRFII